MKTKLQNVTKFPLSVPKPLSRSIFKLIFKVHEASLDDESINVHILYIVNAMSRSLYIDNNINRPNSHLLIIN